MESEEKIVSELNSINQISAKLQPRAIYLAGCVKAKTSLSPEVVYTFIHKLYDSVKIGVISEENQYKIETKLYQGKIGEANEMLNALPLTKSATFKIPSTDQAAISSNRNASGIQIDPQPYQPPSALPRAGPSCGCCSEIVQYDTKNSLKSCQHFFHQHCLNAYLISQINSGVLDIICPQWNCGKIIQPTDMQKFVPEEFMLKYHDYKFKKSIETGEFGNIINCPNPSCSEIFELAGMDGLCPGCNSLICGGCMALKRQCKCHYPGKLRSSKACKSCFTTTSPVPWSKLNYCKMCHIYYCSNCEKRLYECSCGVGPLSFRNCPVCRKLIQIRQGVENAQCLTCNYVICLKCNCVVTNCQCEKNYQMKNHQY